MYPVSDRFLARLAESHQVATSVQLFLTTGEVVDLPHSGGSVTVDRAQAIRRTCTVTCPDPALIPRTATDQLATYGAQLRISRERVRQIEARALARLRRADSGGALISYLR